MSRSRRLDRALALIVALAVACALVASAQAQPQSLEYQVKAAYLAKFVPFVQWPDGALPAGAPVRICVIGADPFGPILGALGRQPVGERRIVPRRVARPSDAAGCHVLYVRRSQALSVEDALTAVRGAPVLTVTDQADGDGPRGVLHFVVSENRVRFEVDAEAASRNQLAVSSKLQSLALSNRSRE